MTGDPFARVVASLLHANLRFIVIGVWGINYYARSSGTLFSTHDRDLFLPLDASNLRAVWQSCSELGMTLWSGDEPLDSPRDLVLAQRVVERRALTSAIDEERGLHVDFSLEMAGFAFDDVWSRRRTFIVDDVAIPVAPLTDMIESKAAADREKDRLFLATYAEAIRQLRAPEDHERKGA